MAIYDSNDSSDLDDEDLVLLASWRIEGARSGQEEGGMMHIHLKHHATTVSRSVIMPILALSQKDYKKRR